MATTKTSFESLSPNLIVKDVVRSVRFYEEMLGFALVASVPETGNFDWAMVQRDSVIVMFQTIGSIKADLPALKLSEGTVAGTLYIKVAGLDALLESLRGQVPLAVELRTTFYGAREFAVSDLDGNVVMFAEDAK